MTAHDKKAGPDKKGQSPPSPCKVGSPIFEFSADKMVICSSAMVRNQCQAEQACNTAGGWHLCTAAEYQAGGGKIIVPPASSAWIASCVRSGGPASHPPTNSICASCSLAISSYDVLVAWDCYSSEVFSRYDKYVGVGTRNACRKVGVNQAQQEAYWSVASSDTLLALSVCCY